MLKTQSVQTPIDREAYGLRISSILLMLQMRTLWFILWVLLSAHAHADLFNKGDKVTLTRDVPLLFNDKVYANGMKGDQFTVYIYKAQDHKVFILTKDAQGITIALNIPDNALVVAKPILPLTAINSADATPKSGSPSRGNLLRIISDEVRSVPIQGRMFITALAFCILWGIMKWLSYKAKIKKELEQNKREAKAFWDTFDQDGDATLPQVSTRVFLKPGEYAVYEEPAKLFESRAVRHYGSGMVGLRVAKGVWIGGSQGRSVSTQQLKEIDSGVLTVTNKRIVFEGNMESRNANLGKIVGTKGYSDAVEIHLENRQKAWLFTGNNPILLAGIIKYCTKMDSLGYSEPPQYTSIKSHSRIPAVNDFIPITDRDLGDKILDIVGQEGEYGVDVALLARRLEFDPQRISEWIRDHPEKLRQVGQGPAATYLLR